MYRLIKKIEIKIQNFYYITNIKTETFEFVRTNQTIIYF